MITVQQLIEKLEKIEDKELPIFVPGTMRMDFASEVHIEEDALVVIYDKTGNPNKTYKRVEIL